MAEYPKKSENLVNLPTKPKDIKNHPALVVSLDIRNILSRFLLPENQSKVIS